MGKHLVDQMRITYERRRRKFEGEEDALVKVSKIDALFDYIDTLEAKNKVLKEQNLYLALHVAQACRKYNCCLECGEPCPIPHNEIYGRKCHEVYVHHWIDASKKEVSK